MWAVSFIVILALLARDAAAFPIRTVSPSTGIFSGTALMGRGEFAEMSGNGMKLSAIAVPTILAYSPTTNTAFTLAVPYVQKRLRIEGAGEDTTHGLGDLRLLGKYRFFLRTAPGRSDQAAFQFGLQLPTGADDRVVSLPVSEPMKRALQPGSGATNFLFDLVYGRETIHYNFNANVAYQLNGSDRDFSFGDLLSANWDFEYFILPELTRRQNMELLTLMEFGFRHAEWNQFRRRPVVNTGGNSLFISPALQWIASERLLFEVSVELPLAQDLRGVQPTLDQDVLIGFRYVY